VESEKVTGGHSTRGAIGLEGNRSAHRPQVVGCQMLRSRRRNARIAAPDGLKNLGLFGGGGRR